MKKVLSFFSFAVLVAAMCVMSGCKDDDKDDDKGGSSNAKALVGRWMLMQSRGADKTEWSDWNLSVTGAIQFDVNGMYSTYIGGVEMVKGTYVVDGKKIVITYSDNSTQTYEIREMSKDKNSMEILLYKSDGTPDTYYRYSRCPKNADEAKQLLMSQWGGANYDPYIYDDDEFVDYTKEGKAYWFYHVRKDLPSDYGDVYKYRGKYICWDDEIYDVEFTPDKTDPTKGELSWVSSYDKSFYGVLTISRLCYQSHYEDNSQFFRVEKPFTYEIVEVPEK